MRKIRKSDVTRPIIKTNSSNERHVCLDTRLRLDAVCSGKYILRCYYKLRRNSRATDLAVIGSILLPPSAKSAPFNRISTSIPNQVIASRYLLINPVNLQRVVDHCRIYWLTIIVVDFVEWVDRGRWEIKVFVLSNTYYIGKSCFLLLNGTFVEDIYESIHRNKNFFTNFIKIIRKKISVTNRFSDLRKFFSL